MPELIDVKKEMRKRVAYLESASGNGVFNKDFFNGQGHIDNADSIFYDPYFVSENAFHGIRTISRVQFGGIPCVTLRKVAQKAWIINTCINHIQKKIKPFLKPVTDRNSRGFLIYKKGEDLTKTTKDDKTRDDITDFICNCGNFEDSDRDSFVKYCLKIVRDSLTIDQVATELQYTKDKKLCAFYAVDAATIEKVIHDKKVNTEWKYIQVVDGIPSAGYTTDTMLFDFENPRTDIYHSQYGYSYVEQAVDLITSFINTFVYNAGNFTENKLPKGMLLINGDATSERVEAMEDYIAEIMSGGPLNQWRIPIIPAGDKDASIEWKQLNGSNREMEFQQWNDYLTSAVVAMFGCSMDELGIQSQKSQTMFENSGADRMSASKSLLLGDLLTFLESYINKIVKKINPDYLFEFVGYEKDNPNTVADLDEKEVRTWKSINEKRAEKGLDPIDLSKVENGADLPMNVQLVQMFQAAQAQAGMGEGMEEGEGDNWENYGDNVEGEQSEESAEDEIEEEIKEDQENGDFGTEENEDFGEEQTELNKSLFVRI